MSTNTTSSFQNVGLLGKANIDRLLLISTKGAHVDLSPVFITLTIYENLFSHYVQADLVISDDLQLMQRLNISGDEYVYLQYGSSTKSNDSVSKKTLILKVFSISPSANLENGSIYTLRLISKNYFFDSLTAVSKTFRGKISDIVGDVYSTYLNIGIPGTVSEQRIAIEETTNSVERCFPLSSPSQIIQELALIAVSKYGTCDFLFYETVNGSVFRSLSHMIDMARIATSLPEYEYRKADILLDAKQAKNVQVQENLVLAYQFQEKMPLDQLINSGAFSSQTTVYDVYTKKKLIYTTSYTAGYFAKTPSLNEYPPMAIPTPYASYPSSKIYCIPQTSGAFSQTPLRVDSLSSDPAYLAKRVMNKSNRIWDRCVMNIHGNSNLTVGQGIYFKCPAYLSSGNEADLYDKYLSGKYLISSLKHTITRNEHETLMEVIKDSSPTPVPNQIQPKQPA